MFGAGRFTSTFAIITNNGLNNILCDDIDEMKANEEKIKDSKKEKKIEH